MFRRRAAAGFICGLPLLVFIAAWQAASTLLGEDVLPGVANVALVFVTHAAHDKIILSQGGGAWGFLPHVAATTVHVMVGVGGGALVGLLVGWLLVQLPLVRYHAEPLLEALRVIPPLIVIPFVLVAVGPTELSQVLATGIYAALSMLVHMLNAIANIPDEYGTIARLHGASRWQVFRTMTLPACLPEMLAGLRITLAISLGIAVVAEYLGAPTGIGRVLKFSISFARTDLMLVGIIWVALLGLAFELLIDKVVLRRIRWRG